MNQIGSKFSLLSVVSDHFHSSLLFKFLAELFWAKCEYSSLASGPA